MSDRDKSSMSENSGHVSVLLTSRPNRPRSIRSAKATLSLAACSSSLRITADGRSWR